MFFHISKKTKYFLFNLIFVFAFSFYTFCSSNKSNDFGDLCIYVKDMKYVVDYNGRIQTICEFYSSDGTYIDTNYLENNIYDKDNKVYFAVFNDIKKNKNYLYRIYEKDGKAKIDKADDSNEPIRFLYMHKGILYYTVGGDFKTWSDDDRSIIKSIDKDGNVKIINNEAVGTYPNFACETGYTIIKHLKFNYSLTANNNDETISIDSNVGYDNCFVTPYGVYYYSLTKKGYYFFDGKYHKLFDDEDGYIYKVIPSTNLKKIYIIIRPKKNVYDLYVADKENISLLKSDIDKRFYDDDYYVPNIYYDNETLNYNQNVLKLNKYENYYFDLNIFDRNTNENKEIVMSDMKEFNDYFYNDANNNLYHKKRKNNKGGYDLYKVINTNKEEQIAKNVLAFYPVKVYCENDESKGFYIADFATKKKAEQTFVDEQFIFDVDYDKDKMEYKDGYEKYVVKSNIDFYIPYSVNGKLVFDVDGELLYTDIDTGFMEESLRYDPIYNKYYYKTEVVKKDNISHDKWYPELHELTIKENSLQDKIICKYKTTDPEHRYDMNYYGMLGNYRIYYAFGGLYAEKNGKKLLHIKNDDNNNYVYDDEFSINSYENTMYYIGQHSSYSDINKTLYKVDKNLKVTKVDTDVDDFVQLRNEVIYVKKHKSEEVYRYANGKSDLIMKGKYLSVFGKRNSNKCYIELGEYVRNEDIFTFDENTNNTFIKEIWDKWRKEIRIDRIYEYGATDTLFLYSEGKIKKIAGDYNKSLDVIVDDYDGLEGSPKYYYAFSKPIDNILPSDFETFFNMVHGNEARDYDDFKNKASYYTNELLKYNEVYIVDGLNVTKYVIDNYDGNGHIDIHINFAEDKLRFLNKDNKIISESNVNFTVDKNEFIKRERYNAKNTKDLYEYKLYLNDNYLYE